jgi:NAD-dependent dihydropyrimidine dehydrogenase PreA subunit
MERAPIAKIISSAKKAAISISHYLQDNDMKQDLVMEATATKQIPNSGIPIQRSRIDAKNVNEESFFEESLRCMTCGGKAQISHPDDCMTCFCCELSCPSEAIYVNPIREELPTSFNF